MTTTDPTPGPTPPSEQARGGARPVPRWHVHRRLYDWVLSLAHHRHSTTALFGLSFAESSFFPIPPDVLQIALTLERRDKAWWFAGVSTVASVLGGVAGYAIGAGLWHAVDEFFFEHVKGFTPENFAALQTQYEKFAFLAILTAAFTPIPYKVFTITAGVFGVPIWVLVAASVLGRGGRFYAVAAVMWLFGPPAKRFIDRYFNLLTLACMALLVVAVVLYKVLSGHDAPAAPDGGGTPSAAAE